MRLGANRDDDRPADPAAYWRRRFLILAVGLAVLGVLAWMFTRARPVLSAAASAAGPTSSAATQGGDPLPSAAYGSPWASPSPTLTPSPTVAASTAATAKPKAGASPTATGTSGPGASASAPADAKAGHCAPADIVLSLFTSQPSYHKGAHPRFDVYAVSTATSSCRMAFGPGTVHVVVTRKGHVVWDSSSCTPAPAPPALFELGVPQMLTISWDRAAAHPAGCAGSLPAGATGTFDAVAISAGQSSTVRTFTLVG
jgi:hypothetical protein